MDTPPVPIDRTFEEDTMTNNNNNNNSSSGSARSKQITVVYGILFVAIFAKISTTLYEFPLFPIQYDSFEWCSAWLVTSVFDYYGACLCFGGVVLSSETSWAKGLAWNAAFILFGSPFCCLWIVLWIRNGGSLRLVDMNRRREDYSTV